ncbi:hypothetical protein [Fluviispira sanaruensis]|uniref:Lysine transporter LysE n=1 Tax=Fluviispira sanaruensis TaxID=2493639 RepID=A0A4V0P270_FLUSA|nr:hypothetical protein [Fluviispira sanaruensis]BBH52197.1 hypothetical protein JCM31447_06370 [Fluviispira sanaruensis]
MIISELIIYFFYAIIGGALSTLPPGPLNIRLFLFYVKDERKSLFYFQLGILLVDIIICNVAFIITQKTNDITSLISFGKNNLYIIQILFLLVLLYIAFSHLFTKKYPPSLKNNPIENPEIEKNKSSKLIRHFIEGVVGTLTIPSLLPFWYLWWMGQNLTFNHPISLAVILIAIGVCIGDLFIFKTYRFFFLKIPERVLQVRIAQIEKWVGYIFLLFAFIFGIKFFLF